VRRRVLLLTVVLGRAVIFGHEENNVLQDIPRAGCNCGEGGDGGEVPTSQLHTCLEGRQSRRSEISYSGEMGLCVWTTRSVVVVLAAAGFTLAAGFLFYFPAAGLVAAVDLGSGLLGQAIFLVAVTLDCLVTFVIG